MSDMSEEKEDNSNVIKISYRDFDLKIIDIDISKKNEIIVNDNELNISE